MRQKQRKQIDFMGARPVERTRDVVRQLREAENVLSSYSHASDLLAEALQNGADAIDARSEREKGALRRIVIDFDASRGRFAVTDTGIGMSEADLEIVLTPNVTLKAGELAQSRRGRSRGEKGVGLSFLALASNNFQLRTCDGTQRLDLIVENARDWVQSGGKTKKPLAELTSFPPDELLGSSKYTFVSVGNLDPELFDDDLFSLSKEDLIWILRTRTAVGNTAALFGRLDPADEIEIELRYESESHKDALAIPYRFASPEELVPKKMVRPFESLSKLPPDQLENVGRGAAMRYRQTWTSAGGREIDVYAFVIDGREMNRIRERRRGRGEYFPPEWQGFFVATRDMPTGVSFDPKIIQPRTYQRRMFALFQDDELRLDLGRKTLGGRTLRMMRDIVKGVWQEDLRMVVPRIKPSDTDQEEVEVVALKETIQRMRKAPDLNLPVPYLKRPAKRLGVMALFHELLSLSDGPLPRLRTLQTGVFGADDSLMYVGEPNGQRPLHVLFGFRASDILDQLESEDISSVTADLGVVWSIDTRVIESRGVTAEETDPEEDGATHTLRLHGIGDRQDIRVVVLQSIAENSQ